MHKRIMLKNLVERIIGKISSIIGSGLLEKHIVMLERSADCNKILGTCLECMV